MKVAVFDPVSGASGDMILGALVDAGALVSDIQIELDKLALPVRLIADPVEQSAVRGIRVTVDADDKAHARPWRVIHDLIEHSSFGDRVRRRALAIFTRLAEAEAFVHDSPVDDVHFHEIGGLDTIADICGTCIGLEILAIEQIYCGPLRIGSGFVRAAHGILPVPAPATARLIAESNAPISTEFLAGTESPGELLTPTGAAILTTLSSFEPVQCSTRAIGYGFGTRELSWPNALRVWIGEAAQLSAPEDSGELIIETN
ncbi:MAG TPA: LarC family nickel insertion protein, partial [Thermomicrobiales bacterium]|nr:LarC family nickel insertion protein [Thermomicrobiales bacterium]